MKNWPASSIHWKVSLLTLERIALFLLMGFSVFLATSRILGMWEAFLTLFFLLPIAAGCYRLEVSAPHIRHWANTVILAVMAVLAVASAGSLSWSIAQGTPWNPFPILIVIQFFMGIMAFERRYLALVLETTLLAMLLLLVTAGVTLEFYLTGGLFLMGLIYFFRFSFAANQWIQTVDSPKEIWRKAPPSLNRRQMRRVFLDGIVVLALGIVFGRMMSNADWKISFPDDWKRVIEQSIQMDKTSSPTEVVPPAPQENEQREKEREQELEEMRKLLEKKSEEEMPVEPPIEPQPELPPEPKPRIFLPIVMILAAVVLLALAGVWVYFWAYRRRVKKHWAALRQKDPREFLKAWFEYLRYLLGKYEVDPALFLSPAEYMEQALRLFKIATPNKSGFQQTLLKGWYSSLPVASQELEEADNLHRLILDALSRCGSWRQKIQFHCLAVR